MWRKSEEFVEATNYWRPRSRSIFYQQCSIESIYIRNNTQNALLWSQWREVRYGDVKGNHPHFPWPQFFCGRTREELYLAANHWSKYYLYLTPSTISRYRNALSSRVCKSGLGSNIKGEFIFHFQMIILLCWSPDQMDDFQASQSNALHLKASQCRRKSWPACGFYLDQNSSKIKCKVSMQTNKVRPTHRCEVHFVPLLSPLESRGFVVLVILHWSSLTK